MIQLPSQPQKGFQIRANDQLEAELELLFP
jgi:hypothetical protein